MHAAVIVFVHNVIQTLHVGTAGCCQVAHPLHFALLLREERLSLPVCEQVPLARGNHTVDVPHKLFSENLQHLLLNVTRSTVSQIGVHAMHSCLGYVERFVEIAQFQMAFNVAFEVSTLIAKKRPLS